MIKISIITVNLNNARGIKKTIKSVIEQNYCSYELIIIDGGSTDNSINVIKHYEDKISYWTSETDNGIYHAMNKGIRQANGEYCYFLNAGDYFVNNTVLEKIFMSNSDTSILVGNILMTRDEIVRIEKYSDITFGLFFTGSICHQATFIKRDLFNKYGFYDESLKIVADWKFFLISIILNNESVKYLDVDIAYHDLFGISIIENKLFFKEREKVLKEIIPPRILKDYASNWADTKIISILNKNVFIKYLLNFCYKFMNKVDRIAKKREIKRLNEYYIFSSKNK